MLNANKAKDLFSDYREGTLERSLKIAFEQAIEQDSHLKRDYEAFSLSYDQLQGLSQSDVSLPDGLNDTILARIDKHVWDQKQRQTKPWALWARNSAVVGSAAVVLIFAVKGLSHRASTTAEGGIVNSYSRPVVTLTQTGDGVDIAINVSEKSHLQIVSMPDGNAIEDLDLVKPWQGTLKNPNSSAAAFGLQLAGMKVNEVIVLPGNNPASVDADDSKTLVDFAKSLADKYQVAVEVKDLNPATPVTWKLHGTSAFLNATETTSTLNASVRFTDGKVIQISKQ